MSKDTNPDAALATIPFEEAMRQLEAIVSQLERGEVSLEESIGLYERGEALKKRCETLSARSRNAHRKDPVRAGWQALGHHAARRLTAFPICFRRVSMSSLPHDDPTPGDARACEAIEQVIVPRARDIGGFEVRRALPSVGKKMVGPFVFFDQMGPSEFLLGQGLMCARIRISGSRP